MSIRDGQKLQPPHIAQFHKIVNDQWIKIKEISEVITGCHKPLCGAKRINHTFMSSLSIPGNVLQLPPRLSKKFALFLHCSMGWPIRCESWNSEAVIFKGEKAGMSYRSILWTISLDSFGPSLQRVFSLNAKLPSEDNDFLQMWRSSHLVNNYFA